MEEKGFTLFQFSVSHQS